MSRRCRPRSGLPILALIPLAMLTAGLLAASGTANGHHRAAASATFHDPVGDADGGLAPDISAVSVDHDAGDTIVVTISYANRTCAGPDDGVYVYLDVDQKSWTGGPFLGVEYVLILSGSTREVWATRWNGVAREEVHPPSLQATCESSASSDSIRISRFDVGVSAGFDFLVGTEFTPGEGRAFFDVTDRWTYLLSTLPPPPQAPGSPVRCIVPNVQGKTLAAARTALETAHCRLGKRHWAFSEQVEKGRVISQKPAPGARRVNRSKVDVTVSRGRRPTDE